MSSIPHTSSPLTPSFPKGAYTSESPSTQALISALSLQKHVEGGYFAEIDRNPLTVPNPFPPSSTAQTASNPMTADKPLSGNDSIRNASTVIYYLLTPTTPQGHFHRNKGRTVHTVIEGRGRYVLIHADEEGGLGGGEGKGKKRVESFVVGKDMSKGEKSVWIVEGGKFKASYLLPMGEDGEGEEDSRLLISETVVPGFEFSDHDFLTEDMFGELVTEEQREELKWLVRKE